MPRGKSRSGAASHLPALVDPRLARALGHVLRQHILLAAVQGEVSPKDLAKLLDEGLSQVSYHCNVLRDDCDGMIELVRTEQRRGAVEHYYRASAKTLLPARAWRGLRKGLRAVVGAGLASDLFNDLAHALKKGKLQGTHDHIARTPLVLDVDGQRNVKKIAERATREVEDEQRATATRLAKANGDAGEVVGYTFGLLAFEAAREPVDLHARIARAEDAGLASTNSENSSRKRKGGRNMRAARK